ncbi:glycosyltransferase family 4 protein [Micromonospora sp. AB353]|uniref:glycosyltransferase family 4 protein n=1 Tax=Micromonospora sp. AB353 TaxID=3413282 RepID=UPI003C25E726
MSSPARADHDARPDAADQPRVTFLTQWFDPEPTTMPGWVARSLRRQGLELDVLTGVPNYPTGKVHEGYRAWRRSTEMQGDLRVLRTPLYPSHNHSAVGRSANFASFALSSSLLGSAALRHTDVTLVYSTPATVAAAGMLARLRWGTPYVLMVMDIWPDSVFATGFLSGGVTRRLAEPPLNWLTNQTYRWAHHVTATSPGMRDALVERGVPADRVSVVYNWTDEKMMRPAAPDPRVRAGLGLTDEFVLMYAGNHGAAQGLDVAVRAMAELRDLPDVHLVFLGGGIEKPVLRSLAANLNLQTVHFLDGVEPEQVPAVMAAADLQLVSLTDQPLFHVTLPSKVQSILACAQPVLTCAPGDAARVVHAAGAGFSSPPGDPVQLAQTIRTAAALPRERLRAMGRAGRDHYLAHLGEEANAFALADLLRDAARSRRRGPSGGAR